MTELLQYVTSGFWVFVGCMVFTTTVITTLGWAVHAALLGFRGKHLNETSYD